jgi:hypothetical protein
MTLLTLRKPAIRLGTTIGLIGGLALVSVPLLGLRGPMIYVPYTILVLVLAFLSGVFKFERRPRFEFMFTGFIVASLVLYLYIILIASRSALDIPLWGHAWRLGFLAIIGAIAGVAASRT